MSGSRCRYCGAHVEGFPFCSSKCRERHTGMTPEMLAQFHRAIRLEKMGIQLTERREEQSSEVEATPTGGSK